jgi:Winged helix-turn helix
VLAPFLDRARSGGILVVGQVKSELEARLGRPMALSSVYNLLHRHGWRKLAPDKRHPQSDPAAQQEWKKTPRATRRNPRELAGPRADQADVPGRSTLRAYQRRAPLLGAQAAAPAVPSHAHPRVRLRLCRLASGELDSLILPHVNTHCM